MVEDGAVLRPLALGLGVGSVARPLQLRHLLFHPFDLGPELFRLPLLERRHLGRVTLLRRRPRRLHLRLPPVFTRRLLLRIDRVRHRVQPRAHGRQARAGRLHRAREALAHRVAHERLVLWMHHRIARRRGGPGPLPGGQARLLLRAQGAQWDGWPKVGKVLLPVRGQQRVVRCDRRRGSLGAIDGLRFLWRKPAHERLANLVRVLRQGAARVRKVIVVFETRPGCTCLGEVEQGHTGRPRVLHQRVQPLADHAERFNAAHDENRHARPGILPKRAPFGNANDLHVRVREAGKHADHDLAHLGDGLVRQNLVRLIEHKEAHPVEPLAQAVEVHVLVNGELLGDQRVELGRDWHARLALGECVPVAQRVVENTLLHERARRVVAVEGGVERRRDVHVAKGAEELVCGRLVCVFRSVDHQLDVDGAKDAILLGPDGRGDEWVVVRLKGVAPGLRHRRRVGVRRREVALDHAAGVHFHVGARRVEVEVLPGHLGEGLGHLAKISDGKFGAAPWSGLQRVGAPARRGSSRVFWNTRVARFLKTCDLPRRRANLAPRRPARTRARARMRR